jgi:hypothetical protein
MTLFAFKAGLSGDDLSFSTTATRQIVNIQYQIEELFRINAHIC